MAVRGEEVASSIDAQVRESIEKMVAEIRSSVEDVRVLVDQQLKAALQSVQADVNSFTFLPQIKKSIGELEETFAEQQVAAAPALALGGGGASRVKAAPGLIPELDRVLREERVVSWDGANLSTRLGVGASETAVLVPMVIKDKVSAAVYVDAVGEGVAKFDQASIELLVFTTGLLVDTLPIRKKIPSPSLSGEGASDSPDRTTTPGPAFAAAPAAPGPAPQAPQPAPPAAAPAPAPRPTPPPPAPPPAVPDIPVPTRTDAGTVAINAAQLREMMAAQRPSFNVPSADDFGVRSEEHTSE